MTEENNNLYRVVCDECGEVSFDVLDNDYFGGKIIATWYAGYHGGKEHPDADRQYGYPEKVVQENES